MLTVAVGLGACALLLFATRVRGLGLLWRATAIVCLVYPTLVVAWTWLFIHDPTAELKSEQATTGDRLIGIGLDASRQFGLWDVTPGRGLYFITAGTVIAVVAVFIPAIRTTRDTYP
jgi:hypothetical protein